MFHVISIICLVLTRQIYIFKYTRFYFAVNTFKSSVTLETVYYFVS